MWTYKYDTAHKTIAVILEPYLDWINDSRKRNGERRNWGEGENENRARKKRQRDGGSPMKKQSDYVPGSILDLQILCLWMKPVTSVDDETLGLISSLLLQKLFRASIMRRKTHKSYINYKTCWKTKSVSNPFLLLYREFVFSCWETSKDQCTFYMDLGRNVFLSIPVWQKKERIYKLTSSALSARKVPSRKRGVESSFICCQPDSSLHQAEWLFS